MATFQFKPKQVTKKLLSALPERARDIIVSRYGLGKNTERMTLESIGQTYGITRERVRQIENYAIGLIRKSGAYKESKSAFEELNQILSSLGGIIVEDDLMAHLSKDVSVQNHLNLLLVLGEQFKKRKEDEHFKHRWHIDDKLATKIEEALKKMFSSMNDNDLIPEGEIIDKFFEHLQDTSEKIKNQEITKRWLSISKKIDKNALGEWGVSHSPNIKTKGMRDYAFLVIRKHGSPIHFKEVAKQIEKIFKKKAHVATTHNELIKDPRFVLVGRGLYALKEWGYVTGVVRDVIKSILEKNGPLTKEEIIDKVLKERYVKENTILVNLQNQKYFKKGEGAKYKLLEENTKA